MIWRALPSTVFILLAASIVMSPRQAHASAPADGLNRAIKELNDASGPEAYTALRKIWGYWGALDPRHVEGALLDAASARRLTPAVRQYAGFLAAHARTRRGDVAGARRAIEAGGFTDRWMVVGPFDNEGRVGFNTAYGPEAQFGEPWLPGRAFSGKERPVRWRTVPDSGFPFGWLNGAALFRPEQHICFYAATFVDVAGSRSRRAELRAGARGAMRVYLNGQVVLEDPVYRGHDADRLGVQVELPPGTSQIAVKLCGLEQAPIVSLRLSPDAAEPSFQFRAGFGDSAAAQSNWNKGRVLRGGLGPLEQFEKLIERRPTASSLEAFARYLALTSGDDPLTHKARNLAKQAAELKPSVARLLLAGRLSEDYNQHRAWLTKAEALKPASVAAQVDVLLARAAVEQGGLNWRDAYPYFEQALALEPDRVDAIFGRVDLFNEANMQRSALALLQKAVRVNPHSVRLLAGLAAQLRALGRDTEASEVEARYAQYRFDDHAYLSGRMELALSRHNRKAAEHWAQRLMDTNPDSLWSYATVAKAYHRMGQDKRALAMLKRALEFAPHDVGVMRELSDLHGAMGDRDEQRRLLHRILELRPQAVGVKRYVQHIEPKKPRADEAYAHSADSFLKDRNLAAEGENQRTLVDLSVTTVFDNGLSSVFRQVVFQPLSDSAAALSRNYMFHYQANSQQVRLRRARVYRANGRVDEAVETGIGAANDPSIAMYTSARTYNVQFPRLEAGDVVELRYRIEDVAARNEFADYFGDIAYLESSESVRHAEYVLLTPKERKFYIDVQGLPGLKRTESVKGKQRIYRFVAKNVAAITPEPSMPPWAEVAGFIHVSTYEDYEALGRWYWGLARDQFDLDDETRQLVHQLTDNLPTEREKVAAVYHWVIKNTRYVALEFGIYGFKPRRCVQTVARGWGDCKDKATVIVSMLRELGIDSTIVVLRTQMRGGFRSKVASLAPFDHAIAYVPSLDLYLDGTAEATGITELPQMDHGALGILVNEGKAKLVTLPPQGHTPSVRRRRVEAQLQQDGSARVKMNFETQGAAAPQWRKRYSAASSRRDRVLQDLGKQFPGLMLPPGRSSIRVQLEDLEQPARLEVGGSVPGLGRRQGDAWSIAVTTRARLSDEYGSLSKRELELRVAGFGAWEDEYEVKLPPGFKVRSLPSNVSLKGEFGSFYVEAKEEGGRVSVRSGVAVKVRRVTPAQYPKWRAFCQAVDAAMASRLVVGK